MTLRNFAFSLKISLNSFTLGSMSLHGPHHVVENPTTRTFGLPAAVSLIASSSPASVVQSSTADRTIFERLLAAWLCHMGVKAQRLCIDRPAHAVRSNSNARPRLMTPNSQLAAWRGARN
eukprot:CAMPEP_0197661202 /NCGR_PEP_ID=MMETSP1338-20131121/51317_1 /TAXON_ID=43686 ORGANISM="Pelagodinium beii, Strain RCC1491" /NCGR_SAMPLE_ID=MMETSP1338 /ASSEMBLY_ACC=CAM_ASM_000754 /LENGTH=119 /DNA_ID=CAMNT_0043238717 /DNA_START=249 /DNA_END=605 /DNA_ORIENTATION=+